MVHIVQLVCDLRVVTFMIAYEMMISEIKHRKQAYDLNTIFFDETKVTNVQPSHIKQDTSCFIGQLCFMRLIHYLVMPNVRVVSAMIYVSVSCH